MNGRLENEQRIHKKTEEKLKNMPGYVSTWYLNLKASRKTASTCYDYICKVHKFLAFIDNDVASVGTEDITEDIVTSYFTSIQTKETSNGFVYTSDSYQCTVWSCLDSFLGYLAKHGQIEINYMEFIDKPKNKDLERINETRTLLTTDDFKSILDCVDKEKNQAKKNRNKAILILFMTTGMRKTALTTITVDDIDLENNALTIIDKGTKRHKYNLNHQTVEAINNWLSYRNEYMKEDKDRHLFLSTHGKAMGERTLADLVEKYTEEALGKKLSPHKLRSGYCSILYEKTGDIEFVRRAVGHSSSEITQRYIVTKGDERKKASEIMASIL